MRSLINAFLLIVATIDIPFGLIILMAGATGPQDTIQNAATSGTVAIFGFIITFLGVVAAAFPIGAFCRFLSEVWDQQTAGRRS